MKKLLLISTILGMLPIMVHAVEPGCDTFDTSWCTRHGYTESGCASGYTSIKCPFNQGKMYCHASQVKNCAVGDILWNDNNCYVLEINNGNISNPPSGRQPIGVVFDDVNKLAVALNAESGDLVWQSSNDSNLQYFSSGNNSENTAPEPNFLFFGTQIRDGGMYYSCNDSEDYVAAEAYCSVDCSSANSGNFCLGEYDNDSSCDGKYLSCDNNTGQRCSRTRGCNISNMTTPRLPVYNATSVPHLGIVATGVTVISSNLSQIVSYGNYVSSSSHIGGWNDTVRLYQGTTISPGFSAPAAMACYAKNTDFGSCPSDSACAGNNGGAVGAGHVWFLPSVGDLVKIVNNYNAITSTINLTNSGNLAMAEGDYYWSSSQSNLNGFYSYAYAVRRMIVSSSTSCVLNSVPDVQPGGMRESAQKVVCVYHYGDDWDMSSYSALWTSGNTMTQQNTGNIVPGWNDNNLYNH